jgi:TonB family protein
VGEPASKDSNLFEPAGLTPLGVGQVIEPPMMVRAFQTSEALDASSSGQVVVVRGMISPEGHFTEAEVLASTNPGLDDAALAHANQARLLQVEANTQPGTTPESREIIFTVQFMPRPPRRPAQVDSPGRPAVSPSTIMGSSNSSQ